jgi:hypothetical protein
MFFQKEFERYVEIVRDLENSFREAQNPEEFPLSFFSETRDKIEELKEELSKMEETVILQQQEKETRGKVDFLGDKISKKIYADIRSSLSINDRFRFQRDLFGNDAESMKNVLAELDTLNSMPEILSYLENHLDWKTEDESVQAFKEILEKRFT